MITKNQHGFTLLELMITVAILGVLAGIAIPAYNGYVKTSHKTECNNEIAAIKLAETEYYLDNHSYFTGSNVSQLQNYSSGVYVPSSAAISTKSECDYKVTYNSTTSQYTITASPATGGHLVGEPNMTYTGP